MLELLNQDSTVAVQLSASRSGRRDRNLIFFGKDTRGPLMSLVTLTSGDSTLYLGNKGGGPMTILGSLNDDDVPSDDPATAWGLDFWRPGVLQPPAFRVRIVRGSPDPTATIWVNGKEQTTR